MRGRVVCDPGYCARAVRVRRDRGREAEAVVFAIDALVIAARHQEVDGFRMRVGGENISPKVEGEPERVGLTAGEQLEARAVRAESIRVAARELHDVAGAICDLARVRES